MTGSHIRFLYQTFNNKTKIVMAAEFWGEREGIFGAHRYAATAWRLLFNTSHSRTVCLQW